MAAVRVVAMQMQRFSSLGCAALPSLLHTARCATRSLSTHALPGCSTVALRRGFSKAQSAWPVGLISNNGTAEPTVIPPDFASELVYEVGWQSLHTFIDVRPDASAPLAARAVRVPLGEGGVDFVRRLTEVLEEPSLEARVVLADSEGAEGGAAYEAAIDLQEAGFVNAVVVRGGMKEWEEEGFAMEKEEEEEVEWSTGRPSKI
eukprot:scaffold78441_cov63-Phaeocystis_antarctica.AAC.2